MKKPIIGITMGDPASIGPEITVNSSYLPTQIKMRQGSQWSTIKISNFQAKNQSDATFVFNAKDYPSAEMIDLR